MTVNNTDPPVVTGTPRVGNWLTTTQGEWTFDLDYLEYAYQWLRCDAAGANCVDIGGATSSQYQLTGTDLGSRIRSEVTATEQSFPAPPGGGKLKWSPPGFVGGDPQDPANYPGYTVITITNSNATGGSGGSSSGCRRNLAANTDYFVVMPDTPITVEGGVMLNGGRNVVVIGGEINDTHGQSSEPASGNTWKQIGLYLPGSTGTVHIEGLWIHGVGTGDGICFGNSGSLPGNNIVQVQNCRIEPEHVTLQPNVHPDAIQTWCGPRTIRFYQNTIDTNGTIRTFQPTTFGSTPILSAHFERQNWIHNRTETFAIWDNRGSQAWWPEYHADIWMKTNPAHTGSAVNSVYRDAQCYTCFNPGGNGNISGEAINLGLRPGGDWVPSSMVAAGDYVSPGYQ